jgi:hypothetical protein
MATNVAIYIHMNSAHEVARIEQILRELLSDLLDMIESGQLTEDEAHAAYNSKADQYAQGRA